MTDPGLIFHSFVRRGLSTLLSTPDAAGLPRARFDVGVQAGPAPAPPTTVVAVSLQAAGDVVSLDPRAVVRTAPSAGDTAFEPNDFPAVEFDQADLPWRYTPLAPAPVNERLRPWLCLIVLRDDEHEPVQPASSQKPLPSVVVRPGAPLPLLSQSWAWGHAQSLAGTDPAALVRAGSPIVFSRLLCPRRLLPLTGYTAFVVPAFAAGVRAGLGLAERPGQPADQTSPAWPDSAASAGLALPILYQWSFRTGQRGDFLSLATALSPAVAGASVGLQPLDVGDPTAGLPLSSPALRLPRASAGPLPLEGALISPAARAARDARDWPAADPDGPAFTHALAALINGAAASAQPLLGPPLYGQRQAGAAQATPGQGDWFNQLNLDPRHRVIASEAGEVIEDEQQALVAGAWAQVEGVRQVNERLRFTQAARELSSRLHQRHLLKLNESATVHVTGPLHQLLAGSDGSGTVRDQFGDGPLAAGVLQPAFRRLSRASGPAGLAAGDARIPLALRRINVTAAQAAAQAPTAAGPALAAAIQPRTPSGAATPERTSRSTSLARSCFSGLVERLQKTSIFPLPDEVGQGPRPAAPQPLSPDTPQALSTVAAQALSPAARTVPAEPRETDEDPQVRLKNKRNVPPLGSGQVNQFFLALEAMFKDQAAPVVPPPAVRDPVDLPRLQAALQEGVDPQHTVPGQLSLQGADAAFRPPDALTAYRAAPQFPQPMSEPLFERSLDWLLPGLAGVPPDSVLILEENRRFIEAYLAGLSHALSRKLLWSGFPGDPTGTGFRQFWNVGSSVQAGATAGQLRDIDELRAWGTRPLGSNGSRALASGSSSLLVLLFRSALWSRFPNASVFAVRAPVGQPWTPDQELHPVFSAQPRADVALFAFDLSLPLAADLSFVVQEHPHQARFGLDEAGKRATPLPRSFSELAWPDAALPADGYLDLSVAAPDLSQISPDDGSRWHGDSARAAHLARITFRRPARVIFRAADLVP